MSWEVIINTYEINQFLGGGLPAELSNLLKPLVAKRFSQGFILKDAGDFPGDIVGITRVAVHGRRSTGFRKDGSLRDDYRRPAGHRLDGRQAEAFVKGRIDQAEGMLIEGDQLGVLQIPP